MYQTDARATVNFGAMPAAQVRDARFPLIDYGTHPAFAPLYERLWADLSREVDYRAAAA